MKQLYTIIAGMMLLVLGACQESDRLIYTPENSALNVWFGSTAARQDSMVYNYAYRALGATTDSVMFHVRVLGVPAQTDRIFKLRSIEGDENKIVEGTHYEFGSYVIKAGEVEADFPIYLKTTEDFKDTVFSITFGLKEEENGFKAGAVEYSKLRLLVKERSEKPENWDDDPFPYFPLKTFFGVYSQRKHQFMISVIGVPVFRVLYQGTPKPPKEVSYFEAQYLQKKCRAALEEYNANPENLDRPLSDENGPITF